ncbi:hypothetical protein V8E53_015475 [Lactarius tabidus]
MESDPDTCDEYAHPLYTSISDPEEEDGSEVQSFDEDDMFGLENPDDIVCARPESNSNSNSESPACLYDIVPVDLDSANNVPTLVDDVIYLDSDSDGEAQTSLDDVIPAHLDSAHNSQTSSVGLFDDFIHEIRGLCIDYENASIMAKALYEARSSDITKSTATNPLKEADSDTNYHVSVGTGFDG